MCGSNTLFWSKQLSHINISHLLSTCNCNKLLGSVYIVAHVSEVTHRPLLHIYTYHNQVFANIFKNDFVCWIKLFKLKIKTVFFVLQQIKKPKFEVRENSYHSDSKPTCCNSPWIHVLFWLTTVQFYDENLTDKCEHCNTCTFIKDWKHLSNYLSIRNIHLTY